MSSGLLPRPIHPRRVPPAATWLESYLPSTQEAGQGWRTCGNHQPELPIQAWSGRCSSQGALVLHRGVISASEECREPR